MNKLKKVAVAASNTMLTSSSLEPLLKEAMASFLAGKLGEAELLCGKLLQANPNHALGLYVQGMILSEKSEPEAALRFVEQAVLLEPGNFSFHLTLADLQARLGQTENSRQSLLKAFSLCPKNYQMLFDLGTNLEKGRLFREAQYCYEQAILLDPSQAAAHHGLAVVLAESGAKDRAIQSYRMALRCDPGRISSYNNLANLLLSEGNLQEAEQLYLRGLSIDSDHAEICFNLANLYGSQDKFDDAIELYRKSTELRPEFVEAWDSLGLWLNDSGQSEKALSCFQKALQLKPDWAQALWNKAITLLKTGQFSEGWEAYESRLAISRITPSRQFQAPKWSGQEFRGQRLLLISEQGLGDTVQFVRYAALAKRLGGEVLLECQPQLADLMRTAPGLDQVFKRGEALPHYDWYCPLMSLPAVMKTTLATIPCGVPYLCVEKPLEIRPRATIRVGLAWAGNPKHAYDRRRSCHLADFGELFELTGIDWVILQQPIPENDQVTMARFSGVRFVDLPSADLYVAAQWMRALDLVLSVDTVFPHLAGALNVPVWILLSTACDWRWLIDREDSPWYPSAVLFRQKHFGDWREVILRIKPKLQDLASKR